MFIQSNEHYELINMSKVRNELDSIAGELVGINKVSIKVFNKIVQFSEERYGQNELNIHYENAFVGIVKTTSFFIKVVTDLAWAEIDDAAHFDRATSVVYPNILARERL